MTVCPFPFFTASVCDPYIANAIDIEAVWPIDQAATEVRYHLASRVELHHWIKRRAHARVAAAALKDP